jgi:nucleolar pre-ribosomal-associated protein 1
VYEEDPDGLLPRKRAILREYLESQKIKAKGDSDVAFLPSFFQAWDFAAETNFDTLLSQVTAILALLLKVLASSADLLEYGTLLCKTVLQTSVAKRFNRSLSAPASKENIISPILRLLTEITRFNEGAHAKAVYAKRDFTLDPRILARNIGLWKDTKGLDVEKRKPSIRTHAVRYFLTHMTYLDELAKTEILSNTSVVRGVFDHIHADSPSLISEIFNTMKHHVFQDKTIMRSTKSRILTGKTLSHIASLYRYETSEETLPEGRKPPDEMAHEFLCLVCTSPAYGVMLPSYGYYPPMNEDEDGDAILEDVVDSTNGIAVEAVEGPDGPGRIRNIILGEFVQSLRPYASILQQELVIAIFKACPELVAPYFHQKEAFNHDPKLTSTWIGYSSFLYQAIELPFPQRLGGKRSYKEFPPAVAVVMQSILPQPLNQAVLVKCLNSSSELINLFAIRLLIVAFNKLRSVLQEYSTAASTRSSQAWEHGRKRLVAEFCQRCPSIKTAIQAFRRPTFQKDMMREAIVRLLRMYFEVTPQVALEEKFDVSVALCNALIQAGKPTEAPEEKAFRVLELEHWMQIARHSSSMRWWQKSSKSPGPQSLAPSY